MAASASLLCFVSLFSLFLFTSSTLTPTTIKIPLYQSINHPSSEPLEILRNLASLSVSRARNLKSPKTNFSVVDVPLYSRSFGGYSIPLSFGTPPQPLRFIMDTGSTLVWFPCTSQYTCSRCNFLNVDQTTIPTFIPRQSSSAKLVGCRNPKCQWILGPDVKSTCRDCSPSSVQNCTQSCPPYAIQYGSGSTAGLLLSETLVVSNQKTVPNFLVGCSISSSRQPEGIAGFGRGQESLPSQLGARKFSYCLLSRRYDEAPVSTDLILYTGSDLGGAKTEGVNYTKFVKNPDESIPVFQGHYYVWLRRIYIGGKNVHVPYNFLMPGSDGNGGTVLDSGSTFTFMERPIFELVAQEFEKQMAGLPLATEAQNKTGLRPCFNVSGQKSVDIPGLMFNFKGGAKMALPISNYFVLVDNDVACLTIVTDNVVDPGAGPAILLGNFQQQNYYIEYDLENNRFGFKQQQCK